MVVGVNVAVVLVLATSMLAANISIHCPWHKPKLALALGSSAIAKNFVLHTANSNAPNSQTKPNKHGTRGVRKRQPTEMLRPSARFRV